MKRLKKIGNGENIRKYINELLNKGGKMLAAEHFLMDLRCFLAFYSHYLFHQPKKPGKECYFYRRCGTHLEVVVMPCVKTAAGGAKVYSGKKIHLILRQARGNELFRLTDTRHVGGHRWQIRLNEKLNLLQSLVIGAPWCGRCGRKTLPCRDRQPGLCYRCPDCHRRTPLEPDKTHHAELHHYLKKPPKRRRSESELQPTG